MKFLFTLVLFVAIATTANAKVDTVTCQNGLYHFLPVTINVTSGDTIHWVWVSGDHIVGPISASDIPNGAAMWAGTIDAAHLTFDYVVTVPGHYHYVCHPATPHGEDAYMVATAAVSGIQPSNIPSDLSAAYPNPFSEKITIESSVANLVLIYNSLGEKVNSFTIKSGQTKQEIDLTMLPKGIFFYSIIKDGIVLETRKIVKD